MILTRTPLVAALGIALFCAPTAQAQLGDIGKKLGLRPPSQLSDQKIASGLKEALHVGSANAVALTGKPDGFFKNDAIKILMPPKLHTVERGLRAAGFGTQVDGFVLSMNRAAERAAPLAKDIFWHAITQMSFDDARRILGGGDTAATEYFRAKTSDSLTTAFRPVVDQAMNDVGTTREYNALLGRARSVPFLHTESLDINAYVVGKALDGLFHVLGEEERKIRKDPAARVTDLLKEVFR